MKVTRLLAALLSLLLAQPAIAQSPAPPATPSMISPEDALVDLAAMYGGLQAAHVDLYAYTPRRQLDAALRRERRAITGPLTRFEFQQRLQRFAARVRMGHTRVDFLLSAWRQHRSASGRGFPLEVRIVDGRVFVAENRSGVATIVPGDEIVTLNGRPASYWLRRTGTLVSAETPYMAWSLQELDFAPLLWAELGEVGAFHLTLRRGDGRTVRAHMPARTAAEMQSAGAAPQPFDPMSRAAEVLPGEVGYLRPGPFYNVEATTEAEAADTAGFTRFIDEAFDRFRRAGVRRVLIDLRGNPGGDNSFSDRMVAWFADRPFRFFSRFRVRASAAARAANDARLRAVPTSAGSLAYAALYARTPVGGFADFELPLTPPRADRFDGDIYVLVDRRSYSNAVNVAAIVQDYRFGVILGEETGDVATIHGAMERFTLPRSGVTVGFPKAFIIRPSGDLRVRGVRPDVSIHSPIVADRGDPMLAEAVSYVRGRPNRPASR